MARRTQIEEALRQSQKMEAIGQLTGGVAHDFNNLLTIILGNLESLEHRLPPDDKLQRHVAAAVRGASRAAVLTNRLLAFSRRQPLAPKVIDVNALVAGMSDLLRSTLGEGIRVEAVLGGEPWPAFVDASQLENALINLAVNARDAMPDGRHAGDRDGKLRNRCDGSGARGRCAARALCLHLGQRYRLRHVRRSAGEGVRAVLHDQGYRSGDRVGPVAGLRLYQAVRRACQDPHRDRQGNDGRLYLPRRLEPVGAASDAPLPPPPRGRIEETVLVVEDDPDVRAYTEGIVGELGYRVLTAGDADAALKVLDAHPAVNLLFTDVGLPGGRSGRQLADEARRRHPPLKVLFTTGYARDAIVHGGRLDPGIEVVFKPFRYSELALKIRHVLDA